MHSRKGGPPVTENWLKIQRLAIRSYVTIGSRLLLVSQPPPNPCQSTFPRKGPATRAPVDLSKIAKEEFTHWTYCVRPTAPLVSGGAAFWLKPVNPRPKPSN